MIGYVTLGTNNFEAAMKFYDALFSSVGASRLWKHGDMAAWDARGPNLRYALLVHSMGNQQALETG